MRLIQAFMYTSVFFIFTTSCFKSEAPENLVCPFLIEKQESGDMHYHKMNNGSKHGLFFILDEKEKVKIRGNYEHGILSGPLYRYHQNGQLSTIEPFVEGLRQGGAFKYSDTGIPTSYIFFKNDSAAYIAEYDDSCKFVQFNGSPIVEMYPPRLSVDDDSTIRAILEMVKPPLIETTLYVSEYVTNEEKTSEEIPFVTGQNELVYHLKHSNTDQICLKYVHAIPIEGGKTKNIRSMSFINIK